MYRLKITKANGDVSEHDITPRIEYLFELHTKKGFHKCFREDEKQSDLYYLAWECLKATPGEVVKTFGVDFLDTLKEVNVLYDDQPLS